MISLSKSAADPTGHYARPDVTRLLLNKTRAEPMVTQVPVGMQVIDGEGTADPAAPGVSTLVA